MNKIKSEFVCQNCGAKSPAYLGHCPQCGAWGSYVETPTEDKTSGIKFSTAEKANLVELGKIKLQATKRIATGISEVDRVLGGGIVPASVILIAGEPGIGKSTLLTQIALKLSALKLKVIYITGEESVEQINLRAHRFNKINPNNFYLAAETDIEKIVNTANSEKPDLVIIDSIQTMFWSSLSGTPGSVGQVRECTRILAQTGKKAGFSLILVGHVTKEGAIAGPKVLEHLVDVVLYFEGDLNQIFRILTTTKNRYGKTSEVGVFEMGQAGLAEVENPSKFFISKRLEDATGSAIFPTITGTRPILVEVQALISPTNFSQPRRSVNGLDFSRVAQILAILGKIFKIPIQSYDLYVSVAGGLKISEPAADLPTALSILSVFWGKPVNKIAAAAEIGLLGELREIPQIETRVKEAAKFGISKFLGPDIGDLVKAAKITFKS